MGQFNLGKTNTPELPGAGRVGFFVNDLDEPYLVLEDGTEIPIGGVELGAGVSFDVDGKIQLGKLTNGYFIDVQRINLDEFPYGALFIGRSDQPDLGNHIRFIKSADEQLFLAVHEQVVESIARGTQIANQLNPITGDTYATISIRYGSNFSAITMQKVGTDPAEMVVLDQISSKGLGDSADYSANKTSFSYVTKMMLEAELAGLDPYVDYLEFNTGLGLWQVGFTDDFIQFLSGQYSVELAAGQAMFLNSTQAGINAGTSTFRLDDEFNIGVGAQVFKFDENELTFSFLDQTQNYLFNKDTVEWRLGTEALNPAAFYINPLGFGIEASDGKFIYGGGSFMWQLGAAGNQMILDFDTVNSRLDFLSSAPVLAYNFDKPLLVNGVEIGSGSRITEVPVPASSAAAGSPGEVAYDTNFEYKYSATLSKWVRKALDITY